MSVDVEAAIMYTVTWITAPGCCRKCALLHGRQWTMADLDRVQWFVDSLTHPNCKCTVDIDFDIDLGKLQVW